MRTWDDLSLGEKLCYAIIINVMVFFLGGFGLMFLTAWLLPVGFGYWASGVIMLFARMVLACLTSDITKETFK